RIVADPSISTEERAAQLARVDAEHRAELPEFRKEWQKCIRELFMKAMGPEKGVMDQFADIVDRSRRLQAPVLHEVNEQQISFLTEDGKDLSEAFRGSIERNFDPKAADAILDEVISHFQQVYQLWDAHQDSTATTATGSSLGHAEDLSVECQQYLLLRQSRESSDVLGKWWAIDWITINFQYDWLRLLEREAEDVYRGVLNDGLRRVYRKVRHQLSRFERRAFQLLYFRQPCFDFRIAAEDPVLLSFVYGMDQETQRLILAVLVFKWGELNRIEDPAAELERRWRAYL